MNKQQKESEIIPLYNIIKPVVDEDESFEDTIYMVIFNLPHSKGWTFVCPN